MYCCEHALPGCKGWVNRTWNAGQVFFYWMSECLKRSQEPPDTRVACHRAPQCASCLCGVLLSPSLPKHPVCEVIFSLNNTGKDFCILWALIWCKWTGCGVGEDIPKRRLVCHRRGIRIHTEVYHQGGRVTSLRVDSLACVSGHGWDPDVWKSICLQV